MESQTHIDLVKRVYKYIVEFVAEERRCLIETDSSGSNSKSYVVNNFIPDVFYSFGDTLILGEAKTELDFERKHSKEQYDAYIEECRLFQGNAMLVIGVPWQVTASAKNYFRRKKQNREIMFKVVIVDEMGRSHEL